jgi:hypothetical protein
MKSAEAIVELIQNYLNNEIDQVNFNNSYPPLLAKYEEDIDDSAYYPLDVLAPSENNDDKAWKQNMKEMYLSEIAKLDDMLEDNEPSYSETMSVEKQKEHCREALERLPIELLDRSTKSWVKDELLEDDEFIFFDERKRSKLGCHKVLYVAPLESESFLITALNGSMPKFDFDYSELLQCLKKHGGHQRATWIRCSEPDGFSNIEVSQFFTDPYQDIENLHWIEHTGSQSTQGGVCHLILIAEDRSWMLLHTNTFSEFKIELHGSRQFIDEVSRSA